MSTDFKQTLAFFFVVAVAMFAVFTVQDRIQNKLQRAQIENCENAKADRIDNARAATAHAEYLERVLNAASVKQDVKAAATDAIKLWAESANQQRRRLYDCETLVKDHKRVLDRDALLEAQGQL